jgi:hypothetical protein
MAIRIDRSLIGTNMENNLITNLLQNEKVKAKDVCGNVTLYNADYVTIETDVSSIRSVVCETDATGKCINAFVGLPFPIEIDENSDVEFDFSSCIILPSFEGTLIRVFFSDGKWFTSTNRKLNAFKSKWAAKHETFGQRFQKAMFVTDDEMLETKYEKLGRDKQHMFFLRASPEERIVCDAPNDPTVLFVGSFDPIEPNLSSITENCLLDIEKNEPIQTIHSNEELFDFVRNSNCKQTQGLLVFVPETNKIYKILSKQYHHLSTVRGGVPSLKFRYMMLRSSDNLHEFLDLYPQMNEEKEIIEEQIYSACKRLHQVYCKIYVYRNYEIKLQPEEDVAIKRIHTEFLKTRIVTTEHRVVDILSEGNPSVINKLIKLYEKENHLKISSQNDAPNIGSHVFTQTREN